MEILEVTARRPPFHDAAMAVVVVGKTLGRADDSGVGWRQSLKLAAACVEIEMTDVGGGAAPVSGLASANVRQRRRHRLHQPIFNDGERCGGDGGKHDRRLRRSEPGCQENRRLTQGPSLCYPRCLQ